MLAIAFGEEFDMAHFKLTAEQLADYRREGYIVLRQAFSPTRIQALRDAVNRLIDRALAGGIEIPFIDRERRIINRTGDLLLPPRFEPEFVQWQEEDLLDLMETLVGDRVRHSLFGMLAGGGGKGYHLAWHRDLTHPQRKYDPAYWQEHPKMRSVQFNAPILDTDTFLQVVPRSHNRNSTPEEITAFEADAKGDMPGMMTVHLEPGDITCYNALIWHRGYNPHGLPRWTMHAAYWVDGTPVMAHEAGKQKELLLTPGHLDKFPPRSRQVAERYIALFPQGQPMNLAEYALSVGATTL